MTPAGLAQLKSDEGLRLRAYPDPQSPLAMEMQKPLVSRIANWQALDGKPWTCGYGCTTNIHGEPVQPGDVWTMAQADAVFLCKVSEKEDGLISGLPWFEEQDPVRADVLVNLAYNLGVAKLLTWKVTLSHFQAKLYEQAHDDLLNEGRWNRQVGGRALRLALATLTGTWT